MKKLTIYFLIVHTVFTLITGFGIWFILYKFFPDFKINHYFIIPLFFFLIGSVFISRFRLTPVDESNKMINLYMFIRSVKIFVALAIILIYWIIDKENIRNFAIIFVIFYIINLIWETYIYLRMELYYKYKSKQKESPKKEIDK